MTDDESDVDAMNILTRREVLSGGSIALLSAMGLAGTASAQTGTEPRIQLGADWEIDDYDDGSGNNNLRIRHQPSGAELVYNVTENQWELPNLNVSGSVSTDDLDIGTSDLFATGDFVTHLTLQQRGFDFQTTSTAYVNDGTIFQERFTWDNLPASASAWATEFRADGRDEPTDIRLRAGFSGENVFEVLNITTLSAFDRVDAYTPSDTTSVEVYKLEIRADDGSASARLLEFLTRVGVQV